MDVILAIVERKKSGRGKPAAASSSQSAELSQSFKDKGGHRPPLFLVAIYE
jgi:hypothetical protein